MIRVCIITEFEQKEFFQWTIALKNDTGIAVDSVVINPAVLNYYPSNHPFWDTIKNADVVFVYCARHNMGWKWYELPLIAKNFMNPKAKMICQFDLEFLWLWYPNHFPWAKIDQWSDGKTPEEFFAKTDVLKVADAYIVFFNSHLKKFISKPIYEIPLPQLTRFKDFLSRVKKSFEDKNGNIVILKHSVKSASYEHTLDNVIKKLNLPVTIFTCEHTGSTQKFEKLKKLPSNSRMYGRVSRSGYVDLLEKEFIAVDDNEGYNGWSRFVMECALTHVPCVGSTLAVKEFFPELYTKHKDYNTQRRLIKKLCNDRKFWIKMAKTGKKNVLRKLNTEYLVSKFIEVTKVKKSEKPTIGKREVSVKEYIDKELVEGEEWKEYQRYTRFVIEHRPRVIPLRPAKGAKVYDPCTKDILSQKMWDFIYGRWRKFIEGKKPKQPLQKAPVNEFIMPVKPKPKPKSKPEPKPKLKQLLKPKPKPKPIKPVKIIKPVKPVKVVKTVKPVEVKKPVKPKYVYTGGVYAPSDPTVASRFIGKDNVTVIIPSYNQKYVVIDAIKKLNSQLTKGDKIIVVDDGSIDGTFHSLSKKFNKKLFPLVEILRLEKHEGVASAVKVGVLSVKTTHSCGNIILVDPNEKIDEDFVANIMKGLWSSNEIKRRTKLITTKRKIVPVKKSKSYEKKTICLYASYVHSSNIQSIADYLNSSKKYNVIWSQPWHYRENKIIGEFPEADVFVTCSSEHRKRLVFDIPKTIYTMHGLSPAELECIPAHNLYLFKGVLLSGQWYLDKIKEGAWGMDYSKFSDDFFKIVGWMKGDILFSPKLDEIIENIKLNLKLKLPYEKTILYSPTGFWRYSYGCFYETATPLLDAAKYLKVNVIIKEHFATCGSRPYIEFCKEVKKRCAKSPSVTWIGKGELDDITPLYKLADVVVSGASSTLLENLQVDKPSIEMLHREPPISKDKMKDWQGWVMPKGTTIQCRNPKKELRKLLARAIYHPDEFAELRKKWRKKLFIKVDGHATERTIKAIEEYMLWD